MPKAGHPHRFNAMIVQRDDLPDMLWIERAPEDLVVQWMIGNLVTPRPDFTMVRLYDRRYPGIPKSTTLVFPIAPRFMTRAGFIFHKDPEPPVYLTSPFPFDWIGDV